MSLLEDNIIKKAMESLETLELWISQKDEDEIIENNDIYSLQSELTALVDLRRIENSGISDKGLKTLAQIDIRTLRLMRINANLE